MLGPGDVIERYEVLDVLGEGGHAVVYRVRHTQLGSSHALKVLSLHRRDLKERLMREGRIQATLDHPNIVPVTDVLEVGGAPALLMPYVSGPTLSSWVRDRHPVPLDVVETVFRDIVHAVCVAHSRALVHRDLKPSNVMMSGDERRWIPRVADFGIAKIVADDDAGGRTGTGVGMGTPSYMAPEQVTDAASVDQRADIFALGCILYEMTTGRRLFDGTNPLLIVSEITSPTPTDLGGIERVLPSYLRAAIEGCVEKDRTRRLPDCAALLEVLGGLPRSDRAWTPSSPTADAPVLDSAAQRTMAAVTPAPGTPNPTLTPADLPAAVGPISQTIDLDDPGAQGGGLADREDEPWTHPPKRRTSPLAVAAGAALAGGLGVWAAMREEPDAAPDPIPGSAVAAPVPVEEAPTVADAVAHGGETPVAAEVEGADETEGAEAPAPVAATPREPPPPVRAASVTPTAAPAASGRLKINSVPWSSVVLDGASVGNTWVDLEVEAGPHTVRLRTEDGLEHEATVQVPAEDVRYWCWNFDVGDRC